jgi:predicted MFS family arabinose efflux permease
MKNRSVIEVMVLVFVFTVCFVLVGTTITIGIVEIKNPQADTATSVQSLVSIISGILGALLGLLAGKSQRADELDMRPDGSKAGVIKSEQTKEEDPLL